MPTRDLGQTDMDAIVQDLKGSSGIENARYDKRSGKVRVTYSDGDTGTVDKRGRVRITEEDRNQRGRRR